MSVLIRGASSHVPGRIIKFGRKCQMGFAAWKLILYFGNEMEIYSIIGKNIGIYFQVDLQNPCRPAPIAGKPRFP
jgi:hypothetical protein